MKFTAIRADLLTELRLLSAVVERKTTIPVLQTVKLAVVRNKLTLTGTDLDRTLDCEIKVTDAEKGGALVDCRDLRNIVAAARDELVTITYIADEPFITVVSGKATWQMPTQGIDAFPESPKPDTIAVTLPLDTFRANVAKVLFAVTQEQSRFTLSVIKTIINGSMKMVATDGHRCAIADEPGVTGEMDVLIPLGAVKLLNQFPRGGDLEIGFGTNLTFRVGRRTLITRILSGQFPNWKMIVPKDYKQKVSFDAIAMTHALKQARAVSDLYHHGVYWDLATDGLTTIRAESEGGTFKTQVVSNYKGEALTISLNHNYLYDFVSRLSGVVEAEIKDANAQILFNAGKGYQYICMPLRY